MPYALGATVVFGQKPQSDVQEEWENEFTGITGYIPWNDPNAEEQFVEKKWTLTFALYSEEGLYTDENRDVMYATGRKWLEEFHKQGIIPKPSFQILHTVKGKSLGPIVKSKARQQMQAEGQSDEEIARQLEALTDPQVLEEPSRPRTKRLGPSRPARHRRLKTRIDPETGEIIADRPWLDYIIPGHTQPYWQELGLDNYDDKDPVDQDLWRLVYKAWYRTTPKYKRDLKAYNKGDGRGVQSRWEKTDLGKETRAKYFATEKGIDARAASQKRSRDRLKLGQELKKEGLSDAEIEIIFWKRDLRPLLKTEKDLDDWIRSKYGIQSRINPGTGDIMK